ncbi:retention module-containing protein, partial [Pseudomonas sp. NPDC087358]|uniref:retention module-containing protein n=1 Tax=Pseudomonas sp. NPDC087358 TaxID=3364439 RepID=UPI00384C3ABA
MSSVVAIVKSIVGQVVAVSPEGIRRVLIEGDRLLAGEQILTGPEGAVTLELADGRHLDIGRDTQWSADAPTSTTDLAEATAQAAPSVAELQQAIAAGADPTQDLEPTAAGDTAPGAGGDAGGGHSVVMLTETAGVVDPTIGYPTAPIGTTAATGILQNAADDALNTRTPSTLSLTGTSSITEAGGVLVYTATLTVAAQSALSVTLSNGQIITIEAGQLSGSVNVPLADGNDVYINPSQISTTITGTSGGDGIAVTTDPQPATTQVTDTVDTTTVSLSSDTTATEGGQITYTATLTNAAQTAVSVTLSNGAVISIAAGESSGSINVNAPANDVYKNTSTVTATISNASGGNFEQLAIDGKAASTTIVDSIDTTRVTLAASSTVAENGTITYTATVSNAVTGSPVSVTLDNGKTITIGVGQTSGSTTAVATNDVYVGHADISGKITGVSGGNFENLTFSSTPATTTVSDVRDTTTLSISGPGSVTEGGNAVYSLALTNPTHAPVTVTLSYSGTATDGTDFTAVKTVTIPANANGTTFTLATTDNNVIDGTRDVTVKIVSASGGNFEDLAVSPSAGSVTTSILDNDMPVVTPPADSTAPIVDLNGAASGVDFALGLTADTKGVSVNIADAGATVSDDKHALTGATIDLKGGFPGDTFDMSAVDLSGTAITFGPGTTDTHIVLVGNGTDAEYQAIIKAITFSTTSDTAGVRSVEVVVTDDGGKTGMATTAINVVAPGTTPVTDTTDPVVDLNGPGTGAQAGVDLTLSLTGDAKGVSVNIADTTATVFDDSKVIN